MPSQVSIKKAQGLLVELTNKQTFIDSLKPVNEGAEPVIKISVDKLTLTVTPSENSETYKTLVDSLSSILSRDLEKLPNEIVQLLNS